MAAAAIELQLQAVVPATSGSAAASGSGGVSASELVERRVAREALSLEEKAGVEMDRMDKLLTDVGLEPFFSVHDNRMRGKKKCKEVLISLV